MVTLAVVAVMAGAGALAWRAPSLLATDPGLTGRIAANAAEIAVIDGGTLRLNRTVVRLLGVEPPPRGEACGHASDCGSAAANALAGMARRDPVSCEIRGRDQLGRPLAVCQAAGVELNRALVAAGWARADGGLAGLSGAESEARAGRRGLWFNP